MAETGDAQPPSQNSAAAALQAKFEQGMARHQQGKLADAERIYREVLQQQPDHFDALHLLGVIALQTRRMEWAIDLFGRAIALKPDFAGAYNSRGIALRSLQRPQDALASYDQTIALTPDFAEAHNNRGNALLDLKRPSDALASYDKAIALKPDYAEAYSNRGLALNDLKRPADALASYDKAIALKPDYADAYGNRGLALLDLKRPEDALASYDQAIALKPDYPEAHNNRGNALRNLKRAAEALASYDKAIALKPDFALAHNNRGNALSDLKRAAEALASYDRAIALKSDYAEAYNNCGNALLELNRRADALTSSDKAIALKPDYAEAYRNRGEICSALGRYDEAFAAYDKAFTLNPDLTGAEGDRLDCKLRVCDWSNFDSECAHLIASVRNGNVSTSPFKFLAISSSSQDQFQFAKLWTANKYPPSKKPIWQGERYDHNRIRVAYLSPDFREHPLSFLMAGMFECHDKSRFDVTAISCGPDDNSEMRRRLMAAFERFIDAKTYNDDQIASLSKELEIEILVDLTGFTAGARTNVFAKRPAPIQVNYMGYPGTMGAPYIDYIIADRILIPESQQEFYSEKTVVLPDSYLVNDSKRSIADRACTRTELGLPLTGFVFCCFNNNYKITPGVFDRWMRILKQVDSSVLWLLEDNAKAAFNLKKEAVARGIDAERLIFAKRMLLADHLARHRLADLFLDTLPVNAVTTASDALWAGLPVLTCLGETFVGRVAASLLSAIGLPELITTTSEGYERMAIDLATHPEKLATIKRKLAENRLTTPLFDTELFTKHFEAAFTAMYERHQVGMAPDHIMIAN